MKFFYIKQISNAVIAFLTVIMSITFVACSGVNTTVQEQPKLTDEEIKQDIILPLLASHLDWYSWDNCEKAEVYNIAGYAVYKLEENNKVEQYASDCGYSIPNDILEKEVKKYFDVDVEYIRTWWEYSEDEKIYDCSGALRFKESGENIEIKSVLKENGNTVINFDINNNYDFVKSYKLTVDDTKDDIKLLSLKVTDKDYYELCVGMNITFVDYEFEKSTDLNSEQLFNYAMFIIDGEEIGKENWDKWVGEYESCEWTGEGIPLSVLENTLTMRLGEYNFNPEEVDCYDKQDKVFRCMIGGYGGVRFPQLREKTMEGDILTLAIDYYSAPESEQTEEDLYETIYTKMKINEDYSYKLLSITKKQYE